MRQPHFRASTLVAGIPTAGTRGARLAGKVLGEKAHAKLTTDHSAGAGHRDARA